MLPNQPLLGGGRRRPRAHHARPATAASGVCGGGGTAVTSAAASLLGPGQDEEAEQERLRAVADRCGQPFSDQNLLSGKKKNYLDRYHLPN